MRDALADGDGVSGVDQVLEGYTREDFARCGCKDTILRWAMRCGSHEHVIQQLMDAGATVCAPACIGEDACLPYASFAAPLEVFRVLLTHPAAAHAVSDLDSAGYPLLYYFARNAFNRWNWKESRANLALLLHTFPDLDVSGRYLLGEDDGSHFDHDVQNDYGEICDDDLRHAVQSTLFDLETIARRRAVKCPSEHIDTFAAMLAAHRAAQMTVAGGDTAAEVAHAPAE